MEKIDERGKVCPFPLFHTKRKICSMRSGEEVEVIVDDPTAKETIPKWSKQHGHDIVSIEDIIGTEGAEDHIIIVIRKGKN